MYCNAGLLGDQAIADSGFGAEMPWPGGVGFQLAPQLRHVHAQVLRLFAVLWAPDLDKQLPLGYDLSRVAHERFQETELDWRQVNFAAADTHYTCRQVNTQIASAEGGSLRAIVDGGGSPEGRSYASQEFPNRERLADVVVCSQI